MKWEQFSVIGYQLMMNYSPTINHYPFFLPSAFFVLCHLSSDTRHPTSDIGFSATSNGQPATSNCIPPIN